MGGWVGASSCSHQQNIWNQDTHHESQSRYGIGYQVYLWKEGLLNTTRFYLAEQSEGTDSFYYKNLGCDIEPVFESFNKSFDTLQKYVENYGEI